MSVRTNIVEVLKSSLTRRWWKWIVASPFLIVLFEYLAVAPVGSQIFLWFEMPFMLSGLGAMIAVVVLPFVMMLSKWHKKALAWWIASLCFLPLTFSGFMLGKKIRNYAFHDLADRSAPLVAAIHKYSVDNGSPPESLNELVPNYLSEVPGTGMMAYSEFRYEVGEAAERYEGNPWVLRISTPSGGINFDEFMYFPLHNYPERGYGGSFQQIGDWAYLHE